MTSDTTPGRATRPSVGPVDDNAAGFADVPCVRYYRTVRKGVGGRARQIGYGVNRRPPAPVVRSWLTRLYHGFLTERVTDYDTPQALAERGLVAWLAAEYLGTPDLGGENVVLCNGSSEAISIVMAHAARRGLAAVLPLPVYFSFEQSASRHGLPIAGYYNSSGVLVDGGERCHDAPDRLAVVDVAPNGVLGSWFQRPPDLTYELLVVDHVFAMPTYVPKDAFRRSLAARIDDLNRTVVMLTPSKDLSIPGLRCGTLITRDSGLLAHAYDDRFERGYTVHGATVRVSAAHLALLLLVFEPDAGCPALARTLRRRFAAVGLDFLADWEIEEFLDHMTSLRTDFRHNIDQLDGSGLFRAEPALDSPVAGYSGFRALDLPLHSGAELTRWVNDAGLRQLKLNPNYLFGADPGVWNVLYPQLFGIRVNLSVPPEELARDLAAMRDLVHSPGPVA